MDKTYAILKEDRYSGHDDTSAGLADRLLDGIGGISSGNGLHSVYFEGTGSVGRNAALHFGNTGKGLGAAFRGCM